MGTYDCYICGNQLTKRYNYKDYYMFACNRDYCQREAGKILAIYVKRVEDSMLDKPTLRERILTILRRFFT